MSTARPITRLSQLKSLTPLELANLQPVEKRFVFRSNTYYDQLIDWNDPNDPIRQLIVPRPEELDDWGALDASLEELYTVAPGLQHKYRSTALLLVNDVCAAYCRFCFRKRLFMDDNTEVVKDVSEGIKYIRAHQEISNVLLTGGDPLVMSTPKLKGIIEQLTDISHIRIIRIGSKIPAFDPHRVTGDSSLTDLFHEFATLSKKIYIMAHFTHPRELTNQSSQCLQLLQQAGAITVNQTPLIAGINSDSEVLGELFNLLSFNGAAPYYVFQCRPTLGDRVYSVPLQAAYRIFTAAQATCSGLAKRARFVMSHSTGKIEVIALDEGYIYMKYHHAVKACDENRLMIFPSNEAAHWFDDYSAAG